MYYRTENKKLFIAEQLLLLPEDRTCFNCLGTGLSAAGRDLKARAPDIKLDETVHNKLTALSSYYINLIKSDEQITELIIRLNEILINSGYVGLSISCNNYEGGSTVSLKCEFEPCSCILANRRRRYEDGDT